MWNAHGTLSKAKLVPGLSFWGSGGDRLTVPNSFTLVFQLVAVTVENTETIVIHNRNTAVRSACYCIMSRISESPECKQQLAGTEVAMDDPEKRLQPGCGNANRTGQSHGDVGETDACPHMNRIEGDCNAVDTQLETGKGGQSMKTETTLDEAEVSVGETEAATQECHSTSDAGDCYNCMYRVDVVALVA